MDTGTDFLTPEFLNVLFFEQKNLVIFPYVDLKHLKTFEIFSVGHNIIDLESTALYNLKEVIELEAENYSQTPNLYLIYNLTKDKAKELLDLKDARCILNVTEDVRTLANGEAFIFYNKKHKKFINYDFSDKDLEFEKYLIAHSENETILLDSIQKIKSTASKLFTELNKEGRITDPDRLLGDYKKKFWPKIVAYAERYYHVKIPEIKPKKESKLTTQQKKSKILDFSEEYDALVSTNRNIGTEFIQLLHNYVQDHVNTAHLEAKDLYNPQKLYSYLRTHHWDEGIPEEFIFNWIKMENTQYSLKPEDLDDFETIFHQLNISDEIINKVLETNLQPVEQEQEIAESSLSQDALPLAENNFSQLKEKILSLLENIEKKLGI